MLAALLGVLLVDSERLEPACPSVTRTGVISNTEIERAAAGVLGGWDDEL